jgi:hypothetical protein
MGFSYFPHRNGLSVPHSYREKMQMLYLFHSKIKKEMFSPVSWSSAIDSQGLFCHA